MSFQAYLDNIEEKTGLTPRQFVALAHERGSTEPSTKAGAIVDWLKADYDLGRGHAMALVYVIRNGPQIDAKHVNSGAPAQRSVGHALAGRQGHQPPSGALDGDGPPPPPGGSRRGGGRIESAAAVRLWRNARPSAAPTAWRRRSLAGIGAAPPRSSNGPRRRSPSNDPQYLVPVGSGRSGHPTHFPGQAMMADVVRAAERVRLGRDRLSGLASRLLDVVGRRGMGASSFRDGRLHLPGRERRGRRRADRRGRPIGGKPIAWTSTDGRPGRNTSSRPWEPGERERMTAVVAGPGGSWPAARSARRRSRGTPGSGVRPTGRRGRRA